jgi:hypothetical protein
VQAQAAEPVPVQPVAPVLPPVAPAYKAEEIEALVAPIALYPDALLAQVLMASTYPLEVVQAARWAKANRGVKGEAAVKAVEGQSWDVSVKSLAAFPQVLEAMDQKLDWTQKLGDAFLAQKEDVFSAVQRLRVRAQESGHLQSNEQQTVSVEQATGTPPQTIVRIEPANPQVIYVPVYDPVVVYGTWGYPGYPPYYWPPSPYYYPGYAFGSGFVWGVGLIAAGAIYSDCDWGDNDVDIDIDRATNIDRKIDRSKFQDGKWRHNAEHRRGVAYRDHATQQRFAGRDASGVDARRDYRGRDGPGDRGGGGLGDRGGVGHRNAAGRDNAFQGVGGGDATQRDFNRGRSTANFSGGSRFGGGGFGGFRGGGRGGRR